MSVSFDKRVGRENYVARPTVNGVRKYIGSFETKEQAERAVVKYKAALLKPTTTEGIDFPSWLELLPEPKWLAPFRRLQVRLLRKKLEKEMDKHLEKVR